MIISTGLRTDIPAFYSRWFLNRIREGFVLVRNPYNNSQVTRYSLSPDFVDLISFCTKNPAPMLPHLNELENYGQFWFVTITPYGKDIEPNVPDKKEVMDSFRELSEKVGVDSVGWRYDPVFVDGRYTVERHIKDFSAMAAYLKGYTKTCVISFIDLYRKVEANFPEVREVTYEEKIVLGKAFSEIAAENGMTLRPCMEGKFLQAYGADCSGCMTVPMYEKALGMNLDIPKKDFGQKKRDCACFLGMDIGAYDTCPHLCRYCYANSNSELVRENMRRHNPDSPYLIGNSMPGDIVHEAKQTSWIDKQMRLF